MPETTGEGVQVRLVVGFHSGDPGIETVALPSGEDLGELGDVPGEGIQVQAAVPDLRELGLLVVTEVPGSRRIQLATSRA